MVKRLESTPQTVTIGSEIHGVDLEQLDDATADAIYRLLVERGVVWFRNQTLGPDAHVALAESFGPLTPRHPLYPHVDGYPITRIRTDLAHPPEAEVWHSDLSCRPNPPFVSVLKAHELPPVGGDTLWVDMRAVHDALPEAVRIELAELTAEHTLEHGFRFVEGFGQADRAAALHDSNRVERSENRAEHPAIVRHPATGREIVYLNESFTTRLLGTSDQRSAELLALVTGMARHARFQVRMRWQPGTVVIWDNYITQHFAVGDFFPEHEREVRRITVAADRRSRWFDGSPVLPDDTDRRTVC